MEKKNGKTMKGLPISERPYEKVLEKGPVFRFITAER